MTSIASLPSLSPFFYDGSAKILKRGFMDDWANLKHLAIRFSCLYRPPLVIQSFQGANVLWAHFSCSYTFGLAKPCEGNERIISPSPSLFLSLIGKPHQCIYLACLPAGQVQSSRVGPLSLPPSVWMRGWETRDAMFVSRSSSNSQHSAVVAPQPNPRPVRSTSTSCLGPYYLLWAILK